MRPIGFSTGAIARSDFRAALQLISQTRADAIELSALRLVELDELIASLDELDLTSFRHVSFHAPGKYPAAAEFEIVRKLQQVCARGWPVVVHPDAICDFALWRGLGECLLIENMDRRKPVGRTAAELEEIFKHVFDAGLCFDIAHARQYDPSMTEAYLILRAHGHRLRQVHLSEVNTGSDHARISFTAMLQYRDLAPNLSATVPVILETPVTASTASIEMDRAEYALGADALPSWRETA